MTRVDVKENKTSAEIKLLLEASSTEKTPRRVASF